MNGRATPRGPRIGVEELLAQAGWVHRLAARILGDGADAEEVVQDTWVAALEADGPALRSRGREGLRAWLGGVVRNLARRRRNQRGIERNIR